jgi:hypothetical protein
MSESAPGGPTVVIDGPTLVALAEDNRRRLFRASLFIAWGLTAFGLLAVLIKDQNLHLSSAVPVGVVGLGLISLALARSEAAYQSLRIHPVRSLVVALVSGLALIIDHGWNSTYYLASFTGVGLASITGGVRWALACAALTAGLYWVGLLAWGFTPDVLDTRYRDLEHVIWNTAGWFLVALLYAVPLEFDGRRLAGLRERLEAGSGSRLRVVETGGSDQADEPTSAGPSRSIAMLRRFFGLSMRHREALELYRTGLADDEASTRMLTTVAGYRDALERVEQTHPEKFADLPLLTPAERKAIRMNAKMNFPKRQALAYALGKKSVNTVNNQFKSARAKLEVSTDFEAFREAVRRGEIAMPPEILADLLGNDPAKPSRRTGP